MVEGRSNLAASSDVSQRYGEIFKLCGMSHHRDMLQL